MRNVINYTNNDGARKEFTLRLPFVLFPLANQYCDVYQFNSQQQRLRTLIVVILNQQNQRHRKHIHRRSALW